MSNIWHELRAKNIGGSEVADLYGEGYSSLYNLWHVKAGNIDPVNFDDNETVQSGNWLEAGIMEWANFKWGTSFVNPRVYCTHPNIKGMGCTPDGVDEKLQALAQIKVVSSWEFKKHFKCIGDEIVDAPVHFMLQVQHEMACWGWDENHLIVFVTGQGRSLKRMIVYRDDAIIADIEKRVEMFWDSIEQSIEPKPDFNTDGDLIVERNKVNFIGDIVDMSDNDYLRSVIEQAYKLSSERRKVIDKYDYTMSELNWIIGTHKAISCGDFIVTYFDHRKTPTIKNESIAI